MPKSNPPIKQQEFGGVVTEGDILKRPPSSAVVCKNFRVMPGGWLRLRGGRSLWIDASSGSLDSFYEFRKGSNAGGVYHIAEHFISSTTYWKELDLVNQTLGSALETVSSNNAPVNTGVVTTVRDKAFWANGQGTRAGGSYGLGSLSSWDGSQVRYVGLDPYIPSGSLSVNFTPSGGGDTKIVAHRKFWVGLYNSATGHFSNGVYAGEVVNPDLETTYEGSLTISGLNAIARASHDASELAEVYYVVYSTLDGGEVPSLVMNTTGTDVLTTQSSSIAIVLDDNAALGDANIVDTTKEMPTTNFAPRALQDIAYTNGRVYYVPQATAGSEGPTQGGFSFDVAAREVTSVMWSAAASDTSDREFLGVPEESFPLANQKYTPNGEIPLKIAAAQGDYGHLLVLTKTGTFLLYEDIPGTHTWRDVSTVDGIHSRDSFVQTPYGSIWLTQNKELVLLPPNSDTLQYISRPYNSLFRTGVAAGTPADYLRDPANYIDRYQIWVGSGKSIIHDFAVGGQGYTTTNQSVAKAKTMLDEFGQRYHVMAIGSKIYVQEANPFTGAIPTRDEEASGVYSEINGDWIGQWQDFGDADLKKEFRNVILFGDAGYSAALSDSPITLTWYGDLDSNNSHAVVLHPAGEVRGDATPMYTHAIKDGDRFWYKFRIQLSGHGSEGTYYLWQEDGELDPNFYGTVSKLLLRISAAGGDRSN